jgi:hypothetical protein
MPDLTDWRIRIAHREISMSRYTKCKRQDDALQVFLRNPREVLTVTGADAIEAFVEEKRAMEEMAEQERNFSEGWQNYG